jgi:hypothetical protein
VGNKFVVKTDHNSLKYFLEQKDLSEHQQKWVTKVQAFDFDIEYVKGKKNIVADTLSRRPTTCSLMEISADWKSHLLVEYSKDKFACELLDGKVHDDRYRVIDNVIFYKDRVYLVPRIRSQKEDFGSSTRLSISRPSGVLQNLQAGQGEILLEGSQAGCDETYQ